MNIDKSTAKRDRRIDIVANANGEILPSLEVFYLQSILYAATAANDAFERFARAVVHELDASIIVLEVQEALTHAAALSRFFWPAKRDLLRNARAARLRAAFQMEHSCLENRDLRNALEHFDERLDEFLLADPVGYFFPGPLVESHALADESPGQIFRLVDPFEGIVVILGKKYEFFSIYEEVQRVLELAHCFDQNGGRLNQSPACSES